MFFRWLEAGVGERVGWEDRDDRDVPDVGIATDRGSECVTEEAGCP